MVFRACVGLCKYETERNNDAQWKQLKSERLRQFVLDLHACVHPWEIVTDVTVARTCENREIPRPEPSSVHQCWVYFKHYMQGGRYLITWALPILKLSVRDLSKVTSRNSHWHSMFVSLLLPASWCTTGTVLPWLLTNIWETLVTNTHLNGSKPSKQNAGSGRVALSCWRWCFTLCETFLIIPGYRQELGPGAVLCQWVTSSEQGE